MSEHRDGADDLERVTRLSAAQTVDLHRLYLAEWWSSDRKLDEVRRLLDGTSVVVEYAERETGRLEAFARALSDGVCKAVVFDVIVAPERRGTGLGERLMDALMDELQGVEHVELYCVPELEPFYARYAFERTEPLLLLRSRGRG